jgi:tetratricopeptide (TPR) repeat protein
MKKWSILIIFLLCSSFTTAQERLTLAISKFDATKLPSDVAWISIAVRDALIAQLSQSPTVVIVEREFLEKILEEISLQLSGLVEETTVQTAGRLIGARYFIYGSIILDNDLLSLTARCVDVAQAAVIGTASIKGLKDHLSSLENDLAQQLISILALEQAKGLMKERQIPSLSLQTYSNFHRFESMIALFPTVGLDPARLQKRDNYLEFILTCNYLLEQYPNSGRLRYYRACFKLQLNKYAAALSDIETVLQQPSPPIDYYLLKANIQFQSDNQAGAIKTANQAVAAFPANAKGWYQLGRFYLRQGETIKAAAALISSTSKTPVISASEHNLKTILMGNGSEKILKQFKQDYPALYDIAMCYRKFWRQEPVRDKNILEQALENFPSHYLIYYLLGNYYANKNKPDRALDHFRHVLQLRADFPEIHREMGILLIQKDDCLTGKPHLILYTRLATVLKDYQEIKKYMDQCP